jgi:hypothetical protein
MKKSNSPCDGFRFAAAFIGCAARRYHRVSLGLGCVGVLSTGCGYPATMAAVSGLTSVKRVFVEASAWVSNRAKCSSQSAHRTKRQILQGNVHHSLRSFRDPRRTRAHFSRSGLINHPISSIRCHMVHRVALDVLLFAPNHWADARFSLAGR